MSDEEIEGTEPPQGEVPEEPESGLSSDAPALRPPRGGNPWGWILLGTIGVFLLLAGWTKTVQSDSFCTTCHTTRAAAASASHSGHADVACITCHRGYGVKGAILYVPTFIREVVDQLTPIPIANGTMDAADCSECHPTVYSSATLKETHPATGCEACHGDPSHPAPPSEQTAALTAGGSPFTPHPSTWVQTHGQVASESTETCATCHLENFCMATCHFQFKSQYPHQSDWLLVHGPAQVEQGPDACTLCHPSTFCASCHGTEIPHADDWLKTHEVDLQNGQPTAPCLLCHVEADCNSCHARHNVHNEQGIYVPAGGSGG